MSSSGARATVVPIESVGAGGCVVVGSGVAVVVVDVVEVGDTDVDDVDVEGATVDIVLGAVDVVLLAVLATVGALLLPLLHPVATTRAMAAPQAIRLTRLLPAPCRSADRNARSSSALFDTETGRTATNQ